jgi:flagellar motor switch protein FliN/FliY
MPDAENKLTSDRSTTETALLVRREADDPTADEQTVTEPAGELDVRLEHLRMQLDVMVKVRSLRVGDLLVLARDTVLETIHEHSQDLPVRCGGALLMWAEFEVVEQKLAVRVTRLA